MDYTLNINDKTMIWADETHWDNIGWVIREEIENVYPYEEQPATLAEVLSLADDNDREEIIEAHKVMIEEAENDYNKKTLQKELAEIAR